MGSKFLYVLVVAVAGGWLYLGGGDFSVDQQARAQDSGRSSRSDSESREERRERYRRMYGERVSDHDHGSDRSERSHDWRGRSGDDSRRDEHSSSSSSSGSGSSSSSNRSSSSSSGSSTPSSSSSNSTSTKSSPSSSSSSMNMTEYAKSLVKQYDKNGDNMLQPEEQKELHGRAAASDLNHDGVITIDELVANLSSSAPGTSTASTSGSSGSSSSSSDSRGHHHHDGDDPKKADADTSKRVLYGSAGGAAAATKDGDKRHSYRFTPAAERASSEQLPSRFKAMDKNGDGQVEMSEFSRSWSKSTAAEFERYDLDGDGVITVKEATPKSTGKGG